MAEVPNSATERSSRRSEWGNRVVSAIFGIVVTVAGALILGKLQAHEPHLVYSSTESLPFNGPNGDVSIYQVTISNDGKREVNEVACAVRIPAAKIQQYKVLANPLLNVAVSVASDSLNIQIPNLNPSESVQVSLLAVGAPGLPTRPQVAARGRGITGTEKRQTSETASGDTLSLASLVVATSLAVFSTGFFMWLLRAKSASGSSFGSGDDQRQILAYICRVYGLRDLADQYSAQTHETTYWAEADRLGQIATDSGDGERMAGIERALLGLIEYHKMARASKAVVCYNVALIKRAKRDDVAYREYLNLAKETARDEIERRLKVDRRFIPPVGR